MMRTFPRSGFTLIEIMIVLVLIAIVARIALPKVQISQWQVDGAMRIAQGALQQAERNAVQMQMEVAVSFDTANKRIRLHYDQNENRVVDNGEQARWFPLQSGNRFASPPIGVNGAAGSFIVGPKVSTSPDGFPTVYYHRDGASSTSFEVYLRSPAAKLTDFRALVVTQATGRVDLYRYNGTSWFKASM